MRQPGCTHRLLVAAALRARPQRSEGAASAACSAALQGGKCRAKARRYSGNCRAKARRYSRRWEGFTSKPTMSFRISRSENIRPTRNSGSALDEGQGSRGNLRRGPRLGTSATGTEGGTGVIWKTLGLWAHPKELDPKMTPPPDFQGLRFEDGTAL